MKENKIKSNFTTTAWISKDNSINHVTSCSAIESQDNETLVKVILNEFELTEAFDKEELKEKLMKWIDSMPDVQSTMDNQDKIRDFIYEMF